MTGTILPGVTRNSLITMARDLGMTVREEPYAIDQWQADAKSGKLREAFALRNGGGDHCRSPRHGAAATISPWATGRPARVALRLKQALLDLQTGRAPDTHGWVDRLF